MTLQDYLDDARLSYSQFAELIGAHPSTVARYAAGKRTPDHKAMKAIFEKTDGKVMPNDFFGLAA